MNTKTYALNLKRSNGLPKALQIAERSVEGTNPKNWSNLPDSPVYLTKDKKGSSVASERAMRKTHNFWIEVFGLLKKEIR